MAYKPSELGQTDIVFCLWSEFTRRCMCAWLQVSTNRSLRIAAMAYFGDSGPFPMAKWL